MFVSIVNDDDDDDATIGVSRVDDVAVAVVASHEDFVFVCLPVTVDAVVDVLARCCFCCCSDSFVLVLSINSL